jgi:Tol biopolymer transport system component
MSANAAAPRRLAAVLGLGLGLTMAACSSSGSAPTAAAPSDEPSPTSAPQPTRAALPHLKGRIVYRKFLDQDNSSAALFVSKADGTDARQITRPGEAFDYNPDWSPDGRRIAFVRDTETCGTDCVVTEIYVVDADGSNLEQLTRSPKGVGCGGRERNSCSSDPSWSPDGTRLVYNHAEGPVKNDAIAHSGLFSMNPNGSDVRPFLTPPSRPHFYEDGAPDWNASGLITFTRQNVSAAPANEGAVFVVNDDATGLHRITPWGRFGDHPVLDPTGSRVAFRSQPDYDLQDPTAPPSYVYVADVRSGDITKVTRGPDGSRFSSLTWSPDGRYLASGRYPGFTNTQPDLFLISVSDGSVTPITDNALWETQPDWTPTT